MSPKSLALVAAAVAVMGMAVYLFIQVKSTPAQAHAPTVTSPASSATTTARPSPMPERSADPGPRGDDDIAPPSTPPTTETGGNAQLAAAARSANDRVAAEADLRPDVKQDSMMQLANKAYDSQDFDQATAIAQRVLANDPTNVRMLRIMVSANCIGGDSAIAQQYYEKLPEFDRAQMKTRCERYGVFFTDPKQ